MPRGQARAGQLEPGLLQGYDAARETRERERRRRRQRNRRQYRRALAAAVLGPLAIVLGSYVRAMLEPSSVPLGVRSVEWLRANGAAGLVNEVESVWYRLHAPKRGGPPLHVLPPVGAGRAVRRTAPAAPDRIHPVIRPALPGEGVWRPASFRVRGRRSPVLVTDFRPDPEYPRVVAYVAWIDSRRARLALYPGRYEPPGSFDRGPMSVPTSQRHGLLATFNSGFTYRDGHGGFVLGQHVIEPLRYGAGTFLGYRDGRIGVVDWRGGPDGPESLAFARQNLPLLVARGRPSPLLRDTGLWGATLGNAILVWRSALGVDRHGNVVYAAAPDQSAASLARLMIRSGAVRAIELDINTEWPTFVAYRARGGRDPVKVVPNPMQAATRYLVPDDRDFFAVYAR
jgi:hypothetical protein